MSLHFPLSLAGKRGIPLLEELSAYGGCDAPDPNYSYSFNSDCTVRSMIAGDLTHAWESGDTAVYGCHIGQNAKVWSNSCFRDCTNLTELWIPYYENYQDQVDGGIYMFWGSGIETVWHSADNISLGSYTFRSCNALTTYNFSTASAPSGLQGGSISFVADCPNLTEFHAPSNGWVNTTTLVGLPVIKDLLPYIAKPNHTNFTTSDGNFRYSRYRTTIGDQWLRSDTYVYRIEIGEPVTSIGTFFCETAPNVRELVFKGNSVTSIGSNFLGKDAIKNFSNDLIFPDSVQTFGDDVCNPAGAGGYNTQIDYIYIGTDVTSFGNQAFAGLVGVSRIDLNCLTPPTGAPFRHNTTAVIHVPSNSTFGATYGYEGNTVVKDLPAI